MATAQLHKPEQKTSTWGTIFPNDQFTEAQSTVFVKKLLVVAVSNIAYLRDIFPEAAFGDRSLEGLNLKVLRLDASSPGARMVIKWMQGCFDAMEKKYLRELMIGLYSDPENPETVIESYNFKFTYANGGGVDIYRNNKELASAHSGAEARKATVRLLRTIILLTQTLDSLPSNVMMTMKLFYYDEVTPSDYEPPGFKAADSDNFVFEEEPVTVKVGDVSTAYHSLSVRVKTDRKQFEMNNSQANKAEQEAVTDTEIGTGLDNDVDMTHDSSEQKPVTEDEVGGVEEPTTDANIPDESPAKPAESAVDPVYSQNSQTTEAEDDFEVRCPCGVNKDDGLMIMCSVCKLWQHGVCFLIVDQDDAPDNHICDVCIKAEDCVREPTDPYLMNLSSIEIQATCLWRRALIACLDMDKLTSPILADRLGTEETVAKGLLARLQKEGFVKSAGKRKRFEKIVDKESIVEIAIPKYMKRCVNEDELVEQPEHEVPKTSKITTDSEVDQLTEKTGSLKLNHKREKLSRKNRKKLCEMMEQSENKENEELGSQTSSKRKGRKRTVSKRGQDAEFDVSYSQDVYDEPKRRKKSSVVANHMTSM